MRMLQLVVLVLLLDVATMAGVVIYADRPRGNLKRVYPTVKLRGGGTYAFPILGVSSYRSALERICGEDVRKWNGKKVRAVLVPDPRDDIILRVEVAGRVVGYLAGDPAKDCRRHLRERGYPNARGVCKARIRLRPRPGGDDELAIRLDLPMHHSVLSVRLRRYFKTNTPLSAEKSRA